MVNFPPLHQSWTRSTDDMPRQMPQYQFPFQGKEGIVHWVERYHYASETCEYPDDVALEAGRRILQGELTGDLLRTIYRWKMETYLKRRFPNVLKFPVPNSEDEIKRALRVAVSANRNGAAADIAMEALCALKGVQTPVASAFLTAIHPSDFTVIDIQAYRALGQNIPASVSIPEYFHYLAFCRSMANHVGAALRISNTGDRRDVHLI